MTAPNIPIPRVISVATPAAGADFSITATGRGAWRIVSLVAQLATSAVVGSRAVRLEASDGSTTYFRTDADATQAASLTGLYVAFSGLAGAVGASGVSGIAWPTDGLILPQGHTLKSVTTAIDVGDQYSAIGLLVIEYADMPPEAYREYENWNRS